MGFINNINQCKNPSQLDQFIKIALDNASNNDKKAKEIKENLNTTPKVNIIKFYKGNYIVDMPSSLITDLYINFGIETVDGSISLNLKFINVTMMVNFLSLPP
mgnify:CR=1 FL=1